MRAERAHRYVSLILAHGGIPTYCLPDFFEHVLQPAVLRAGYADMSATELIDQWRWHARAQYFTDKPVFRFLVYGGRVAEDFLDRCREMARQVLDAGVMPDAEAVGLPERVVRAYGEWIEKQGAEQVQREVTDRWRLRRPEIVVDPWGEGVILDLPPQQVPATMIDAGFAWQVTVGEDTCTIPVRARRSGFDWTTVPESMRLGRPAEVYQASFLVDGEVRRTWRYQGIGDGCPLLVFDADRGTALAWRHSLPARRLGLIYPQEYELDVTTDSADEGQIEPLEKLPRMPGDWAAYRGEIWDLERASRVALRQDGEEIWTAILRPDEAAQRPHLVGGELLSGESRDTRAPVYLGSPPGVRIPLTHRGTLEEELARWRVTVYTKWAAIPEVQMTRTLTDLRSQLVSGQGYVDLPLSLSSLLGKSPMGNYHVRLRGPLGRDAEFTLRLVPHLVLCGHEMLYLPDTKTGPQPVTLLAETMPGDGIEFRPYSSASSYAESAAESAGCQVRLAEQGTERWEYEILAEPEVTEVEVTVVRPRQAGDAVRVPVHVPIHRLRWALAEEESGTGSTGPIRRAWTGRTIRQPIEALLQAQSPALLIALPVDEHHHVDMALRLLNVEADELMVRAVSQPPRGHRLWRVDLSAFLDTVRASPSPVLRFELAVRGLPDAGDLLRWPVLSLTRSLIVENVRTQGAIKDEQLSLAIRWEEPVRLRHRRLRLWSLWRPWQPAYERPIPDDAEGELLLEASVADLPPGRYRLEFVVVDPWSVEDAPPRPQEGTAGTADVELISPAQRLDQLTDQIKRTGRQFPLFLERAHVCRAMGDAVGSREDRQRCFEWIDTGTIPQILALHDLMAEIGEQHNLRALELKMFAADRVERLQHEYAQSQILPAHFQAYMAHLPRSRLLPEATCTLLLSADDERARLYAVQQLVQRSNALGPETVLKWVQDARISDADAIAILRLNTRFSADRLDEHLEDPVALRLYETLAQELGDQTPVVRPGVWVRTDAGWGRIERIEDAEGRPVEQFIRGQDRFRLYVTLRPGVDTEPVIVDLAQKQIAFPNATTIYTCAKCNRFSTQDCYLIVNQHNSVAHGGIGPSYRQERVTVRSLRTLEYSARMPKNELA